MPQPSVMSHDTSSSTRNPPPWGLVPSILWGVVGVVIWFAMQFVVIIGFVAWHKSAGIPINMGELGSNGLLLASVTIAAGPAWIATMVFAARLRGWRARDYLALVPPRRAEIVFGIACLAALLIAMDVITWGAGRDIVPPFMRETYASVRGTAALPLFFIAIVIVAPVTEEIAFRGFLFRGLSQSALGVPGTIVLSSAAWAVMHVQYDVIQVGQIILIGVLLGWLRWASGSTLLVIGLHVLANLAATVQAVIKVEWMS
jgi:membrane protease YdiL (CAAX protease family)